MQDYVGYTDEAAISAHWLWAATETLDELNISGDIVAIKVRLKRNGADIATNSCTTGTEGEGCTALLGTNNNSTNENCWAYGNGYSPKFDRLGDGDPGACL